MSNDTAVVPTRTTPLSLMCRNLSLSVDQDELKNILMKTVMPDGGKGVTPEQFTSFVVVANNYGLDPLKKEIYAFPAKGGGIQPVVSIDGWLRIINAQPGYDGMMLEERFENGEIFSVTCTIYCKEREHPTVITEYLSECIRNTDPWKKKIRMLRHKATIQCCRYAFGLSGIMEQDEAEAALEKDITPKHKQSALRLNKKDEECIVEPCATVEVVDTPADVDKTADKKEDDHQVELDDILIGLKKADNHETLDKIAAIIADHLKEWPDDRPELSAKYQAKAKELKHNM